MNSNTCSVLFIIFYAALKTVFPSVVKETFTKQSVVEQHNGISYKRVRSSYFGQVPLNLVHCAFACMGEYSCKSVHIDGEACVFGVDDVTAFEAGELVTPDPRQALRVQGGILCIVLYFFSNYSYSLEFIFL